MIHIAPTTALLLYLTALLTLLFFTWLKHHLRSRKRSPHPSPAQLAICEFCNYAYLADPLQPISTCPSCNLLNKENWYKKSQ